MRASLACGACCLAFLALPGPGPAAADLLRLTPPAVRPGGVAVLRLTRPGVLLGLAVGGRPVPALDLAEALIGVDLDEPPGPLPLTVDVEESGRLLRLERRLEVREPDYPVQRLTLPRRFTELDAATLGRVAAERAVLDGLWGRQSPRAWRGPFRPPLAPGRAGSGFGARRIINGEPRAAHAGLDAAAPAGTPVLAANAGEVALVADHFFSGTSVVLDHGGALFTMYFHLQAAEVQPGQRVQRGQLIGRVGRSGRASGPHLHWGVRLHGARVDPAELLRLTAELD